MARRTSQKTGLSQPRIGEADGASLSTKHTNHTKRTRRPEGCIAYESNELERISEAMVNRRLISITAVASTENTEDAQKAKDQYSYEWSLQIRSDSGDS